MRSLKSYFLTDTTLKTEIVAGITTFLTMVYIAFINPTILHDAGMDREAVFTATCLITAFACFGAGIIANTPIGIAPGMALNIFFSYTVVQGMGIRWQQALAIVFISGILFFLMSLTRLRRLLIEAIPFNLQIAILIGISLLIALITLQNNHIIVGDHHNLMRLGEITSAENGLFFLGFLLILILDYFQIPGAIILSILSITALSLLMGLSAWQGLISMPPSMHATFLQLDFSGVNTLLAMKTVFTFFLISVFDATGTLIGLLNPTVFKQQRDYRERLSNCLTVDAAASTLAGVLGCASTSPYIESAAGIEAGGRSGLTAIVIAVGFLLLLFFSPLAKMIPNFAVGPALLYVACCMMKHVTDMKLYDISESAPCMLTIMMIPFTSSIADGIGGGIILFTLLKLITGQKISFLLCILSIVFILFFLIH